MLRKLVCILPLLSATTASGCNTMMPDGFVTVQVENLRFGQEQIQTEAGKVFYDVTVLDADPPLPSTAVFVTPYHRGGGITQIATGEGGFSTVGLDVGMVVALTYRVKGRDLVILDYQLLLPEYNSRPPRSEEEGDALKAAVESEIYRGPSSWTFVGKEPVGNTARILVAYDEGKVRGSADWTRWAIIDPAADSGVPYPELKASWKARENKRP